MMLAQSIIHEGEKESLSRTILRKINIDTYIYMFTCVFVYIQKEILSP